MSMSKQDFIALADVIRADGSFSTDQIEALAQFCRAQNYRFMADRWYGYIAGNCGKNGGKVKPAELRA